VVPGHDAFYCFVASFMIVTIRAAIPEKNLSNAFVVFGVQQILSLSVDCGLSFIDLILFKCFLRSFLMRRVVRANFVAVLMRQYELDENRIDVNREICTICFLMMTSFN